MNNPTDTSHPLEKVFDLDPIAWQSPQVHPVSERERALINPISGEIIERSDKPDYNALEKEERLEDLHIDGQLENIHVAAMEAYTKQTRMMDEVDPRFAARTGEVAAQYLSIALSATNSRVDAKFKRQKVRIAKAAAGTPDSVITNNNLIVGDRNDVLKALLAQGQAILNQGEKDAPVDV